LVKKLVQQLKTVQDILPKMIENIESSPGFGVRFEMFLRADCLLEDDPTYKFCLPDPVLFPFVSFPKKMLKKQFEDRLLVHWKALETTLPITDLEVLMNGKKLTKGKKKKKREEIQVSAIKPSSMPVAVRTRLVASAEIITLGLGPQQVGSKGTILKPMWPHMKKGAIEVPETFRTELSVQLQTRYGCTYGVIPHAMAMPRLSEALKSLPQESWWERQKPKGMAGLMALVLKRSASLPGMPALPVTFEICRTLMGVLFHAFNLIGTFPRVSPCMYILYMPASSHFN
jgi:hypothetical protein